MPNNHALVFFCFAGTGLRINGLSTSKDFIAKCYGKTVRTHSGGSDGSGECECVFMSFFFSLLFFGLFCTSNVFNNDTLRTAPYSQRHGITAHTLRCTYLIKPCMYFPPCHTIPYQKMGPKWVAMPLLKRGGQQAACHTLMSCCYTGQSPHRLHHPTVHHSKLLRCPNYSGGHSRG